MDISNFDAYVAELSFQYSARRYGIGYNLIDVEVFIEKNGSARVRRNVEVLAYSQIRELDTFLLIPSDSPPSDGSWEMSPPNIKSLTPDHIVKTEKINNEFGRASALFGISPPLFDGSSVTYEMVEFLPVNFYAIGYAQEEIEKRPTKDDYFGWTISRPTRKLSLRISFPVGDQPELYNWEVLYASASGFSANQFQSEEQKRLRPTLKPSGEKGRGILELEVDFPMTGLVYILRWTPAVTKRSKVPTALKKAATSDVDLEHLREIRRILTARFNESELRALCFDLGMDYEALPGKGKSDKIIELITYFKRRGQISELVRLGKLIRSDIAWPE